MWLTKNEKKVLNLLIDNAKLSDTSIANDLKISSQAVGKIRRRLEEDVIKGYTLNLDSKMLGMSIIVILKLKFNNLNNKELEEVEKNMTQDANTINVLKLTSGEGLYALVAGYKDLEELDKSIKLSKEKSHNDYQIIEIIPLPLSHVLKNSNKELYRYLIDSCGIKNQELENLNKK